MCYFLNEAPVCIIFKGQTYTGAVPCPEEKKHFEVKNQRKSRTLTMRKILLALIKIITSI